MANPNPYAPPRALDATTEATRSGVSEYAGEKRAVILCIGLTILTFGLYPAIWLLRRRAFLNSLNASKKLSIAQPAISLVLTALSFLLLLAGKDGMAVAKFANGISGILLVLASFRAVTMLSSDFARTGRLLSVSYLGTFFFGIHYLQYKINRAASIRPRISRES